jgi:AraC-like DNA-binding protein
MMNDARIPLVRVPHIEAGEAVIEMNVLYEVMEQPFSALYIPETDETVFEVNGQRIAATVGDIIAIPRGLAHTIRLASGKVSGRKTLQPPFRTSEPKHDVDDRLFCCRVPVTANPLPDVVPDVLHYKPDRQRANGRLDLVFSLIRHHAMTDQRNRHIKLKRLAELAATILLEGIVSDLDNEGHSVSAVTGDPRLRRVVNAIFAEPHRQFNLDDLARIAGLSRSSLSEHFKRVIGKSPMAYLADHRLGLAARMLQHEDLSVGRIAEATGYETDSSFAKAFRKRYGMGPTAFRRAWGRR